MTELYGEFGEDTPMSMPTGNFTPGEMSEGMDMPGMTDTNPVYVPAQVTLNGTTLVDIGIRFKGFSSLSGSWREGTYKISLKLDCDQFKDEYPEVKGQTLYGFDELNLQSGYGDNSLMRDKVVTEIFRDAGVPAPKASFYQVYIDKGNGPEYFGLYTMLEDVGDTMISSQFSDDSGNLYKPKGQMDATFRNGTFNSSFFKKETNKKKNDYSDLKQFYTALNSEKRTTDPAAWRSDLKSIFDVDEFLTWLATNTVIQNWDTYGSMAHNFYLYTNPSTGQITWIPWDNNLALRNGSEPMGDMDMGGQAPGFGNFSAGNISPRSFGMNSPFGQVTGDFGNSTPGAFPMGMPGGMGGGMNMTGMGPGGGTQDISLANVTSDWPLIRYLMDDPEYHEKYVNAVAAVITDVFNPERMEPIYTKNHELISPYVVGDDGEQEGYTHLKSSDDFTTSLNSLTTHTAAQYEAAQKFLEEQEET
ncbi:MAG: CotH kinase family protein [Methanospirillum sp.]|uniref:CotH kinase family protein n=1 Tax=Methanospirillum sp. TaxID=45200 RepID=UPI00237458C8|nr:CotH kinase family protein [Methanospirillum sp.]MDD1730391.1 CotH kinase family protein [Methanospirillum sp.]